jgi:hypothetical protein
LSDDDRALIDHINFEKASHAEADDKAKQCGRFQKLHGTQYPGPLADNRTVINLCDEPLGDAAYSAMGKGLNYAAAPAVLPTEPLLSGVEKAVGPLPEKVAEEFRQKTVKILKASTKPKNRLPARRGEPSGP